MTRTKVVLCQEEDGSCPFLAWFGGLPAKVQDKRFLRLDRLREVGHEFAAALSRLSAGWDLRTPVSLQGVQYRILYFFHGTVAAVVSHGLIKERAVPPKEIDRALERKKRFEVNPRRHTYEEA